MKKLHLLAKAGVRKISYVASIKFHYSVNRINDAYVFSISDSTEWANAVLIATTLKA